MTQLAAVCTVSTALAYLAALVLIARRRWRGCAGYRVLNAAAVASFVLARVFSNNVVAAMIASALVAAALVGITRRSSALAGVLAAAPLIAMLLTVDRTFFSGRSADDFQLATIAVLCMPGPIAVGAWLTSLWRQTLSFRTKSFR